MTAILLRLLIIGLIGLFIALGVRKIWRDWTSQFKKVDDEDNSQRRARDLKERQRPDVIELRRDGDGVFRPGEGKDDNNRR